MRKNQKNMSVKALDEWKHKFRASDHYHKEKIEKKLKEYREFYKGNHWQEDTDSGRYRDWPVENMVFSNVSIIKPSINLNNPKIFAFAKKKPFKLPDGSVFNTVSAAFLFEMLMNYYWKHLRMKSQHDRCLTDALLGHWGIMWLGYTLETEKFEEKTGREIEHHELIKSESPYAIRLSPMDFRKDLLSMDPGLEDAEWVAKVWRKNVQDVKANPNYQNTEGIERIATLSDRMKKLQDTGGVASSMEGGRNEGPEGIFAQIEGVDLYNKKDHTKIVFCERWEKPLFEGDWEVDVNGFPCETIYFNENPDEPYPYPDIESYLPLQREYNWTKSLQIAHVRNASAQKYLVNENKFEGSDLDDLLDGPDGTVVKVKGTPKEAIEPLPRGSVSQDVHIILASMKKGIEEMAGTANFERGGASKFDTATEPALIQQGISVKRQERSMILEDFIKRVVGKMAHIVQQTMGEQELRIDKHQQERLLQTAPGKLELLNMQNGNIDTGFTIDQMWKILGDDSHTLTPWVSVSKEDIKGDYEFDIEVGSTAPKNAETRKRDAATLAQLLQGSPYVDQYEATRELLETYEIKNDKLLKDRKKAEQEIAQRQKAAQEAPLKERQMKDQTDLQKTQMKSETSLAGKQMDQQTEIIKALGGGL